MAAVFRSSERSVGAEFVAGLREASQESGVSEVDSTGQRIDAKSRRSEETPRKKEMIAAIVRDRVKQLPHSVSILSVARKPRLLPDV